MKTRKLENFRSKCGQQLPQSLYTDRNYDVQPQAVDTRKGVVGFWPILKLASWVRNSKSVNFGAGAGGGIHGDVLLEPEWPMHKSTFTVPGTKFVNFGAGSRGGIHSDVFFGRERAGARVGGRNARMCRRHRTWSVYSKFPIR